RRVWADLADLDPGMHEYMPREGNLLSNPGFELKLLNGGLGWRYWPSGAAELSIDASSFHSGSHALRIPLHGTPASGGIEQYFAVKQNPRYRFSAFLKTETLEGASPPRFAIADAFDPRTAYFQGDEWPSSQDWREQAAEFTTGAGTQMLVLRI